MGSVVERAKAAIARVEALGEGARSLFVSFSPERILAEASEAEARIEAADRPLPLAGMLVSVKDLYDEKGERTTAASTLLLEREPATADCPCTFRAPPSKVISYGHSVWSWS